MTLTPAQIAYMAGIIDGEGGIYFQTSRGYEGTPGSLRVVVTSTYPPLLDWLANMAGGAIRERTEWTQAGDPKRLGKLPCFTWSITGERAAIVLRAIQPYLIVKADNAERGLRLWEASHRLLRKPARRVHASRLSEIDLRKRGWPEDAVLPLNVVGTA